MRLLSSSLAAYGHTYPLLSLAIAAAEQGHEVSFVTGSAFEVTLKSCGVEYIPGGLDMV
ncbi:hypothetical protein SAMN05421504_101223 [Amycolatopsis xylanica]|uniref:Glycosyltransferase, MGT family n=1 Tax=Amycolatopsis xylanica TaxID=589385 RepID=A0A1H2SHB6_9PSEU|nr:glycosyltransferase family 1 protein [Amycolatopsis xylanica]SDW31026.1 hypothetical protein SAMN05421504_101223 [Amycolatopsis xylanica]